jgi:capsular exopolysaccharide synthesis family protein
MANYQLFLHEQGKTMIAEAYRIFRTNLQFAKLNGTLQTIMFTSTGPGEGKSTTVANLAVALAQMGKRVVVMDCDLRRPVQHRIFAVRQHGLTNILTADLPVVEQLQKTVVPKLRLLASGPTPPNPSELLGTVKMTELMETLKAETDYLIIDTSPILTVTDAEVLAAQVDGIVLVIGSGMVRPILAQRTKDLLLKSKGNIVGVVLNRVELGSEERHYYQYLVRK